MAMLFILFVFLISSVDGTDVTRDFYGDIFRMRDCHNGSRCDNGGSRPALEIAGRPCFCQCAPTHLTYREDKQQCVKDIRECYMSVFYRPFTVEAIPLVYLPTSGQLVHPEAHLSLSGRKNAESGFPSCKASVSQYLTQDGWRTLTKVDGGGPVFGLFIDGNKTFLQFLGNSHDRRVLQQHLAMVRLFCRIPEYAPFETCVAIRVGWVPGVDSADESEGSFTKTNIMVVGLSLGILGLVYVFAVLVYLKIRRKQLAKRRHRNDYEDKIQLDEENQGNTSRMETSKRLELYHSTSMRKRKLDHDPWAQMSSIVETYNRTWTDRMGHSCEFRAQDFQLEPEFFEPEHLASPPQEVLEYLERLQNSVTFARHRLRSCYRYQPTLNGIPEDDYFYQELKNAQIKDVRTTPDGGSSSSIASLLEMPEHADEKSKNSVPKIPPKKPKRKSPPPKSNSSQEENTISEQEQKDIQNAMNTLNDTLEALEYDIYKQDLLQRESEGTFVSASCPNSTEGETEDFDSSSCSSLSAVTVLGRNISKQMDINSTGSRSVERNQCEDFSTFSNSTFNAPGLFNHQTAHCEQNDNTAQHNIDLTCKKSLQNGTIPSVSTQNGKEYFSSEKKLEQSSEASSTKKPNKCHDCPNKNVSLSDQDANGGHDKDNGHLIKKSSSTESMTTVATDMTSDSLESRSSSPNHRRRRRRQSPRQMPSLVDMWIGKLIQTSVPYTKSKREPKRIVLAEDDIHGWEHVCQKQQETCPMHDLNDSEPNLLDKLAHYSSKTMAGRDVAGYFQSLKQDILKDHLKSWLNSNNQVKNSKNGISVNYHSKDSCPKKPLVNYCQESNSESKKTLPNWTTFITVNGNNDIVIEKDSIDNPNNNSIDSISGLADSLDAKTVETRSCEGSDTIEIT